jgi:CBS domain-containing protein
MALIKDIMNLDVPTTTKDKCLRDILNQFVEKDFKTIVIVDGDKPVGILTEFDWINKVLAQNLNLDETRAEEVMTHPVITVDPTISLDDAINIMYSNHLRRLVVVDEDKLIGLVEATDIMNRAKILSQENKKLLFYQNIQSYIIFAFFLFIILYLIVKFLLR